MRMSGEAHDKNWYVAQVTVLTNENKRLWNVNAGLRKEIDKLDKAGAAAWNRLSLFTFVAFTVGIGTGYVIAALTWRFV